MSIYSEAINYLIHGHDKNDIPRSVAVERAEETINRMTNLELLELISDQVEERLDKFERRLLP